VQQAYFFLQEFADVKRKPVYLMQSYSHREKGGGGRVQPERRGNSSQSWVEKYHVATPKNY
jgi:hypothetical protein